LQATALVHEAYIRLVDSQSQNHRENRGHFVAAAAEAMRPILVEHARRKKTLKLGGDHRRLDLDHALSTPDTSDDNQILSVHETLDKLEAVDERKSSLVKLRFFAGFTIPEAADILGISHATAERDWSFAKTYLYSQINENEKTVET